MPKKNIERVKTYRKLRALGMSSKLANQYKDLSDKKLEEIIRIFKAKKLESLKRDILKYSEE